MRLGILGGTFNPPHLGHLVCAQEAYIRLGLDRVILIPARTPPHKPVEDEPGPEHRLAMCRLAAAGDDDRFETSGLELERPGPSYTVDTLQQLHSRAPDSELFLIVGGDIAAGLPQWKEPERVLTLATLAIAERSGTSRAETEQALRGCDGEARFFEMPTIAVSSTMVRDRIRAGLPIRYLVPEAVGAYITRHELYKAG